MAVSGRTDTPEPPGAPKNERIFETRLILGQDFSDRFDAAFNWINETDTRTGDTAFGYTFGLNYILYGTPHGDHEIYAGAPVHSHHGAAASESRPFAVTQVK